MTTASAPADQPVVLKIEGSRVQQYNDADKRKKTVERELAELRPDLTKLGVEHLLNYNVENPTAPAASVNVIDETGAVIGVQFKGVYKPIDDKDVEAVEELFTELTNNPNAVNTYVAETVVGSWDPKAFVNDKGVFNKVAYARIRTALEELSAELGISCPLKTTTVVTVKEEFHKKRWTDFPTLEDQQRITATLVNTVALQPKNA